MGVGGVAEQTVTCDTARKVLTVEDPCRWEHVVDANLNFTQ